MAYLGSGRVSCPKCDHKWNWADHMKTVEVSQTGTRVFCPNPTCDNDQPCHESKRDDAPPKRRRKRRPQTTNLT